MNYETYWVSKSKSRGNIGNGVAFDLRAMLCYRLLLLGGGGGGGGPP